MKNVTVASPLQSKGKYLHIRPTEMNPGVQLQRRRSHYGNLFKLSTTHRGWLIKHKTNRIGQHCGEVHQRGPHCEQTLPGCGLIFNSGIEETRGEQITASVIYSCVIKDVNPFTLFKPAEGLEQRKQALGRDDQLVCGQEEEEEEDALADWFQFTELY